MSLWKDVLQEMGLGDWGPLNDADRQAILREIEVESTYDSEWTRERLFEALETINALARQALGDA